MTGPPANVEPWSPGCSVSPYAGEVMQEPIGSPPPRPFAIVITSGAGPPPDSKPQKVPVRPVPHWISS